jgi:hypothetical protein
VRQVEETSLPVRKGRKPTDEVERYVFPRIAEPEPLIFTARAESHQNV